MALRLKNVVQQTHRLGVSTNRFRLTPQQVKEVRAAEARHGVGSQEALFVVLRLLFKSRQDQ